jgi:hypothetical protein
MTSDRIKEALKAEPFRPFRLHLGGGRSLDVEHPELIAVSPTGRTAAVYGLNDSLEIVDILMVQSIEYLPSRGSRRRKAG